MCEIKMTEYTFEIRKTIAINVHGSDTEDNYLKATEEAVRQVKKDFDEDWMECSNAFEYTEYEKEKEYA